MRALTVSLVLVAIFSLSQSADAADLIPAEHLNRYKFQLEKKYPTTKCIMEATLGYEAYEEVFENQRKGGLSGLTFAPKTKLGRGAVFTNHINYQNLDRGLALFYANGDFFYLRMRESFSKVTLFTNTTRATPEIINEFIELAKRSLLAENATKVPEEIVPKIVRVEKEDSLERCVGAVSERKVQNFVNAKEFKSCSRHSKGVVYFDRRQPHFVVSESTSLSSRDEKEESLTLKQGDMVTVAEKKWELFEKDGFACVFYRDPNGKEHFGWVDKDDIRSVGAAVESNIGTGASKDDLKVLQGIKLTNIPRNFVTNINYPNFDGSLNEGKSKRVKAVVKDERLVLSFSDSQYFEYHNKPLGLHGLHAYLAKEYSTEALELEVSEAVNAYVFNNGLYYVEDVSTNGSSKVKTGLYYNAK